MKKIIIYSIIGLTCGIIAPQAAAQRFALKAYDDINFGKAMSITTALPGTNSSSGSNSFGLDFGYTFWRQGGNSLEANIGVEYRASSATFNIADMSYNYAAPATADEDGNPYERYTQVVDMRQKIGFGYFNIPIYLQYEYHVTKWLGLHASAGFGLGFKIMNSEGAIAGKAKTYGVYQEYNQLVVKADYLNDFGERYLEQAVKGKADVKGFNAFVICGAGLEFYVSEPVSFELGVRYNAGLTDVFGGRYNISSQNMINADSAPVTYTVADGQHVKALSDYVTKSRLNPLSLHIGVNVRF